MLLDTPEGGGAGQGGGEAGSPQLTLILPSHPAVYQTLQAAYQRNCTWLSVEAVVSAGGVDGSGPAAAAPDAGDEQGGDADG